jgi:Mrp family chromosome partitioning ATPase
MDKGQIVHVIAVGSGKGGVGKSSVTALLAMELQRQGHSVGILDADITGPSIPKLLGMRGPLTDAGEGIEPARSRSGIPVVSSQFMVEDEQAPVIWRGPLVTRLITQFFGGVNWGKLDYLLIDMPPGTSDVPLTVFQTIPVDGMVFVLTPQDLAAMIVKKAMNMARDLHVALLGVVENMSWIVCPHCHETINLFGPGTVGVRSRCPRPPAARPVDLRTRRRGTGRRLPISRAHGARGRPRASGRRGHEELGDGPVALRNCWNEIDSTGTPRRPSAARSPSRCASPTTTAIRP